MQAKRGLGKGLSALLPSDNNLTDLHPADLNPTDMNLIDKNPADINQTENNQNDNKTMEANTVGTVSAKSITSEKTKSGEIIIPLEKLLPNPSQPRKNYDAAELEELAASIRQQGVIQPVIAEETGDGNYTIIAGERRTRAARIAGLKEIPVVLRNYSEEKRVEVSLIENIQRTDLNPIEEAAAYKQLLDINGLSQDEAAARVGKNRATVANALRLLKLPAVMQESLRNGELTPGHARAILSISSAKEQELLYQEIIKKGISVREAEKRAAALTEQKKKPQKPALPNRAPELVEMEEKFIARLGTKVVVNGDLNKGIIEVNYYSMDDLDRLYEILC